MSFDDFKVEDGGEPVDGEHTAWLERTSVFEAKSGQWFIRHLLAHDRPRPLLGDPQRHRGQQQAAHPATPRAARGRPRQPLELGRPRRRARRLRGPRLQRQGLPPRRVPEHRDRRRAAGDPGRAPTRHPRPARGAHRRTPCRRPAACSTRRPRRRPYPPAGSSTMTISRSDGVGGDRPPTAQRVVMTASTGSARDARTCAGAVATTMSSRGAYARRSLRRDPAKAGGSRPSETRTPRPTSGARPTRARDRMQGRGA